MHAPLRLTSPLQVPLGVTGEEVITSRRNSGGYKRSSVTGGEEECPPKNNLLTHRRFPSTGEVWAGRYFFVVPVLGLSQYELLNRLMDDEILDNLKILKIVSY